MCLPVSRFVRRQSCHFYGVGVEEVDKPAAVALWRRAAAQGHADAAAELRGLHKDLPDPVPLPALPALPPTWLRLPWSASGSADEVGDDAAPVQAIRRSSSSSSALAAGVGSGPKAAAGNALASLGGGLVPIPALTTLRDLLRRFGASLVGAVEDDGGEVRSRALEPAADLLPPPFPAEGRGMECA
jgi:hypothetical protein